MSEIISIRGKKASATIFASNLVIHGNLMIHLTAYGPTQEVRAFAQLLLEGSNVSWETGNINAKLNGIMKIIPGWANGYSGLYVIPTGNEYIMGETEEECFNVLSRILDQAYFVHRTWYKKVAKLNTRLDPTIGDKKCFILVAKLEEEVRNFVKYGKFKFPAVTAKLTVEKHEAAASN